MVSFVKDEKGNILEFQSKGDTYHILNAFVGSVPISPQSYFTATNKRYVATQFMTDGNKLHTIRVDDKKMCKNGDIIEDNYVVECFYDIENGYWIPHRVRFDKTWESMLNKTVTANNIKSAFNIWNTIIDPINIDELLTSKANDVKTQNTLTEKYYDRKSKNTLLFTMNKLHNTIVKNDFTFKRLSKCGCNTILDVACGKGGDLYKWIKNGFVTVIGFDIFEDNIINPFDGIYKRLAESRIPYKHKYVFLPMDSSLPYQSQHNNIKDKYTQNLEKCLVGKPGTYGSEINQFKGLLKKKVDVVSCQFALHYFFESEKKLDGLLQNVSNSLRNGGFFVGTCFDGDSIFNLLNQNENGYIDVVINNHKVWSIKNLEKDKKTFGHKISVYVDSINKEHEEYLVFYDKLVKHVAKFGLRLLKPKELESLSIDKSSYMFEEILEKEKEQMKQYEYQFSFLNRWFIFVKD
jgi:SAM-dependent methyltransferase